LPPGILILVVLLIAVWMLLVRPQRRRQSQQSQMMADLAPGDEVVTAGGLYGTIEEIEDESVRLEIAPDLTVRVAKRAIAAVLPPEEEGEEGAEELEEESEDELGAPEAEPVADEEQAPTLR
jgi:preprotein translocase subunit YajC